MRPWIAPFSTAACSSSKGLVPTFAETESPSGSLKPSARNDLGSADVRRPCVEKLRHCCNQLCRGEWLLN